MSIKSILELFRGVPISANVWLQLTSTLASASVDVPEVEPLTSGGTRVEERERATQQLCSLLGDVLLFLWILKWELIYFAYLYFAFVFWN